MLALIMVIYDYASDFKGDFMIQFITVLLIAFVGVVVVSAVVKSNSSNRSTNHSGNRGSSFQGRSSLGKTNAFAPWPSAEPPVALGVPYDHPARVSAERLEAALGLDFESRVKDRVLKEYPRMTDKEWIWTWFELKRYFLMCGILRGVPMYSSQADAVWHEMLMFTREYEQFCSHFCGEMIHHAPHTPGAKPEQGERAWFDWVYGELFTQAPASGRIWGAFYRTKMPQQRLAALTDWNETEIREQWFNAKTTARYADLDKTADFLIHRAQSQLLASKGGESSYGNDRRSKQSYGYEPAIGATGMLSGLLIFHSLSDSNDFARQMDQGQTDEQRKANDSGGSTYGCSGSVGDGRNDDSGGSDGHSGSDSSGGGDSGGSSCGSSCGGGCSS